MGALVVLAAFAAGAVVLTRWLDKETIQRLFPPAPVPTCAGSDCASNPIGNEPAPAPSGSATASLSTAPLVAQLAPAPSALAELAPIEAGLEDPRRLIDGGGIRAEAMALV